MLRFFSLFLLVTLLGVGDTVPVIGSEGVGTIRTHALAEFSTPRYGREFSHFAYVNPTAPKGGMITLGACGTTFDSLNTIIVRGIYPRSLGLISDSLMVYSGDELDVVYGLVAESVEYPEDKAWAIFHLRQDARFHDGHPITADDFVFTWQTIQQYGRPFLRSFLSMVKSVTKIDTYQLQVTFHTRHDMKPLIQVATILGPQPEHWWMADASRDISKTTLEPPLSSGPYRVASVDAGRSITYERVTDYWGETLAVNRGVNNFDTVKVDYYRDADICFEAFKAGGYDFRVENRAQWWAEGYDVPATDQGLIERRTLPLGAPLGAQGFRCNTRRFQFSDARVREGLGYLFDFEWTQRTLLYGQYRRIKSNFPNSDFGARGVPPPEELAVLERFRGQIPERVFTHAYEPPQTDGSGRIRSNLRQALDLFAAADWRIDQGRLIHQTTGQPMTIEFLTISTSMERLITPYISNLKRSGIQASIRRVDSAQYQRRLDEFDFDCAVLNFNFFPPPGEELRSYFGSRSADIFSSANYTGIKDEVVDILIDEILAAGSLEQLKILTRALDRVLLWGFYMIPQWYNDTIRLAYWTKFSWPTMNATYRPTGWQTWWYDATKPGARAAQ